ncbi:hypothetical protein H4J45_09760 [Colwellia sp. BRX10-6]|uniref:hypothetical protein n=1 Tax=unclassified Colwellia TaxID=196834 RepID=UPI0015F36954|nr:MULTISPECIES: hypothetical protein [unclassified Colwellia]MBA6383659.1 hypothetical protein [Colwellia sp. BRX10-9]MBA6394369.1 hypothetical protein [Colwellia sp. BRX10-6]
MIVDNSHEWDVHKTTGKELNKFNKKNQIPLESIKPILAILELLPKAQKYTSAFKQAYPKTHNTTLEAILPLYMKLLQLDSAEVLRIDSHIFGTSGVLIKKQGLKKIIAKMEDIKHIEVFSGYTFKEKDSKYNKSMPTAIRLIEKIYKG